MYQTLTLLFEVPFDPVEIRQGASVPDIRLHSKTAISDYMADIVMKALEHPPENRWTTAELMRVGHRARPQPTKRTHA